MNQNNLLASVTVFGELYNSETYKGIPDILSQFIQNAVSHKQKYNLTSLDLKSLLKDIYGFEIPESVLRTVLKNNLKGLVTLQNSIYSFEKRKIENTESIDKEIKAITSEHQALLDELLEFISKKTNNRDFDKEKVFDTFIHFLLGNGKNEYYIDYVSAFIVSKENEAQFRITLDSIREGVILYQGINFSTNVSQLGNWDQELTIFLSTEHMFSAAGYNGILFKEIFEDFYSLVTEINSTAKRQLIKLKYLQETKDAMINFFNTAESIVRGYKKLNPTVSAMKKIVDDCNRPSDVKAKFAGFNQLLINLNITFQDFHFDIEDSKYNVVDLTVVDKLKQNATKNNREFNEDECLNILKLFTRVNTFRKGNNSYPFESIKYIYLTEDNYIKYLAHNENVKFQNYDVSFAKDIDFIISKFWFKLKKGFTDKPQLPKSFDAVNRAKIVLSSHIDTSLVKGYEKLKVDMLNGLLKEEDAILLNESYKEKPGLPEAINEDNIDITLDFLNNPDYASDVLREKERKEKLLAETLTEKEKLQKRVEELELKEREKELIEELRKLKQESIKNSTKKWVIEKRKNDGDMYYFLVIISITLLPLILGILLKTIPKWSLWMNSLGNYQYLILGILFVLFAIIEIIGRSYLFDKEKVKRGWKWFRLNISGKSKQYKEEFIEANSAIFLAQKTE